MECGQTHTMTQTITHSLVGNKLSHPHAQNTHILKKKEREKKTSSYEHYQTHRTKNTHIHTHLPMRSPDSLKYSYKNKWRSIFTPASYTELGVIYTVTASAGRNVRCIKACPIS